MGDSNSTRRYVLIDGQKVYLNPEQQQAWDKFINTVRYNARKNGTCAQTDYHLCDGDCAKCPWQREGVVVSLDDESFGDGISDLGLIGSYKPIDRVSTPEEITIARETEDRLLAFARSVCPDGDQLLMLSMDKGYSTYRIATLLGISQTTVTRRMQKLLKHIRAHRNDLFG